MTQSETAHVREISYPSDPAKRKEIIEDIRRTINATNVAIGISQEELYLALDEALTNAIEHGNRWDASKKIHIRVDARGNRVTVSIRDEGEGFNHTTVESNLASRDILSNRGRGIYIISQFCNIAWNEKGNEIILSMPKTNSRSQASSSTQ